MRLFRILILSAVLSFSVVQPAVAQEERGFWRSVLEFFYPHLRTPPLDVEETLQAPFSGDGEAEGEFADNSNQAPISYSTPHRLGGEIGKWLSVVIAETMTFDSDNYHDDFEKTAQRFDQNGRALYTKFLQQSKMLKVLESDKYYIRSFVQDAPLLVNEGVVGEHYRWLFDVPVVVSYMERTLVDYAKGDATTQVMELRVQVARSPEGGEEGVIIDQWEAKAGKVVTPQK